MDCQQMKSLLQGYLDGELDLVRSLDLEQHIEGCPSCTADQASHLSLREVLRSPDLYHRAPAFLEPRIRAAIASSQPAPVVARWRPRLALAAAVALVFAAVWQFDPAFLHRSDRSLESEILSSHVRSLMPGHLTDIESGDGHTVKPWFAGRLDFSPRVVDLTASGFPLAGGRLDYVGGRPVAALVYRRRQHVINLFVWPSASAGGLRTSSHQGYNSVRWVRSGMEYWAVSDLNEKELRQFADLANGG